MRFLFKHAAPETAIPPYLREMMAGVYKARRTKKYAERTEYFSINALISNNNSKI